MKRLNLNLPLLDILAALALILAFLLLITPEPVRADEGACRWVQGENTNALVRSGDCDDGLTGGYFISSVVKVEGDGTETTTTTYNGRPSEGPRQTVSESRIEIARN